MKTIKLRIEKELELPLDDDLEELLIPYIEEDDPELREANHETIYDTIVSIISKGEWDLLVNDNFSALIRPEDVKIEVPEDAFITMPDREEEDD